MRAVVGRMPIWSAGENADVVETAMLMGSRAAEYRDTEGLQGGADPMGLKNNPDGAEEEGMRASGSTDGAEGIKEGLRL